MLHDSFLFCDLDIEIHEMTIVVAQWRAHNTNDYNQVIHGQHVDLIMLKFALWNY